MKERKEMAAAPSIGQTVRYTVPGSLAILPAMIVAHDADRAVLQVFRSSGDGSYLVGEVQRGGAGEPGTWHPVGGRGLAALAHP